MHAGNLIETPSYNSQTQTSNETQNLPKRSNLKHTQTHSVTDNSQTPQQMVTHEGVHVTQVQQQTAKYEGFHPSQTSQPAQRNGQNCKEDSTPLQ
jgi:hypothetical protein